MRIIIVIIALLGFLIIPPNGDKLFYGDDDDDYFAVSSSIAYGQFPSFHQEYHVGVTMPFASVGSGVLAAPFVAAFSVGDRMHNAPIVATRTKENRYWTWSVAGFHFASYFYVLAGCGLLFAALRQRYPKLDATIATTMIVIAGGGLLMYAFRRPVMSHAYEFFVVAAGVYLIALLANGKKLRLHAWLLGVTAAFIFLVRYNNLPLAFGVAAIGGFLLVRRNGASALPSLVGITVPIVVLVGIFRVWPAVANGLNHSDLFYGGGVTDRITPSFYPPFYFERLWDISTDWDMGLVFTAPALLLGAFGVSRYCREIPRAFLVLAAVALIDLYFAVMWRSFGSFYGYRHFAFTGGPLVAIYLCALIAHVRARIGSRRTMLIAIALCVFPVVSMAAFGLDSRFNLDIVTNKYGVDSWSNPYYQLNVLQAIWNEPAKLFGNLWLRGLPSFNWETISHEEATRLPLYFGPPLLMLVINEALTFYQGLAARPIRAAPREFRHENAPIGTN